MAELPRYKSDEFNLEFAIESHQKDLILKFKKDGELNSKTEVKISEDNYDKIKLLVIWRRPTAKGKEAIRLMDIWPTDGFLEFLGKFYKKKGFFFQKYWVTEYGAIVTVCELCKEDQEKFRELVRKSQNIDELLMVAGLRS